MAYWFISINERKILSKMRTLITGGAGFIGCHLAERLVKLKHKVIILDNLSTGRKKNIESIKHKVKFIKCDI